MLFIANIRLIICPSKSSWLRIASGDPRWAYGIVSGIFFDVIIPLDAINHLQQPTSFHAGPTTGHDRENIPRKQPAAIHVSEPPKSKAHVGQGKLPKAVTAFPEAGHAPQMVLAKDHLDLTNFHRRCKGCLELPQKFGGSKKRKLDKETTWVCTICGAFFCTRCKDLDLFIHQAHKGAHVKLKPGYESKFNADSA